MRPLSAARQQKKFHSMKWNFFVALRLFTFRQKRWVAESSHPISLWLKRGREGGTQFPLLLTDIHFFSAWCSPPLSLPPPAVPPPCCYMEWIHPFTPGVAATSEQVTDYLKKTHSSYWPVKVAVHAMMTTTAVRLPSHSRKDRDSTTDRKPETK